MPDEKGVVGELKPVIEFSEVGRDSVAQQFDVGDELISDLSVADKHCDLRCRVTAVDDAPEPPQL